MYYSNISSLDSSRYASFSIDIDDVWISFIFFHLERNSEINRGNRTSRILFRTLTGLKNILKNSTVGVTMTSP